MTRFQVFQITPQGEDVNAWDFDTFAAAEARRDQLAWEDCEAGGTDTFAIFDADTQQELDHDPAEDVDDDRQDADADLEALRVGTPVYYYGPDRFADRFPRTGTIVAIDGDTADIRVDGHTNPEWHDRIGLTSLRANRPGPAVVKFTPTDDCPF